MTTIAEYGIKLGLEPTDINERVSQELNTTEKKVHSFFRNIKEQTGRESLFGGISEMLMGGGALIGFTKAGEVLNKATEAAVKLNEAFNKADASAADIFGEFAKGLPIIGGFYTAGSNLREFFTGEKAAVSAANDEIKRQDALFATLGKATLDVHGRLKALNAEIDKLKGVKGYGDAAKALGDEAKAALAAKINALTGAMEDARKKQADLQAEADSPFRLLKGVGSAIVGMDAEKDLNDRIKDNQTTIQGLEGQLALLRNQSGKLTNEIDQKVAQAAALEAGNAAKEVQKGVNEQITRQNEYIATLEEKTRENKTRATIEGLRSAGEEEKAAAIEILEDRYKAIREAQTQADKELATATDQAAKDRIKADLQSFIDSEDAKAEARGKALAKAPPPEEDLKYQLARQDEGRRHNFATLTERFQPPETKAQKDLAENARKQTESLFKIQENTDKLQDLEVQSVSLFGGGG